ncbi:phage/plasmid primase, P4 family [uncultured Reyranella sp.]|uniref:phage/plasmid primase, P4 family n=1 Tax=uncultured Reyranella sp. TaxID=735512 RepID=UPI0025D5E5A6|nr:phage/plasmid primase, P4 family [uncultured Reyranella sp.]
MSDDDFAVDAVPPDEGDEKPGLFFASDEALALQFAGMHLGELRYVAKWAAWFIWTGTHWRRDETLAALGNVRSFCRAIAEDIKARPLSAEISSAKKIGAIERLCRADQRLAATVDQWDADPWALNTPAGVVDLRSGELRPHRPEDHFSKITAVGPDGGERPLLWLEFLDRVTGGDREIENFLQRVFGYCLTGDVSAHAMFFLYGLGGNGKSVAIETIAGILGEYHRRAPMETFMASHSERHPTDLAMLQGARMVTASEVEAGARWAESKIKAITGGDTIPARFMRGDYFEYRPQFKLILLGNHKPVLRSVDEAMRRRLHMINFGVTIPAHARDPELREKLKREWPAILQWCVEGALEYRQQGLAPPSAVVAASAEYLAAEDAMAAWIDECCDLDPASWTGTTKLFGSWRKWAEQNGEHPGSSKRFSQDLQAHGIAPQRTRGARGFAGLTLKPETGRLPV